MPRSDQQERRAASNLFNLNKNRIDRDIAADYPPPGDLATRAACQRDFRRFCETYFPHAFHLEWSDDHLTAIERMEAAVLTGGLFALAMPRGGGKTALSLRLVLWSLLYGHRRFVCLIAATADRARELLDDAKTELTFNEALIRDFRQVCYPLVRLENNARKAIGQLFRGEQTRIDWSDARLTFPTLPDYACDGLNVSGSTVTVAGLTGALRGQSTTLASGTILRPELVILDDPQTRESAMSELQSHTRAAIIQGDVLGMGGPGLRIAAVMPCTVIREGDMASELLDRTKAPAWNGQRTKMVYAFPTDEKLWEEYKRLRQEGQAAGRGTIDCDAWYATHRAAMDAGAVIAWPARKYADELSALQHAMNLRIDLKDHAFFAEYQNAPLPPEESRPDDLTPDQVAAKLNRLQRGAVPLPCNRLTAFIDVHATLLYYAVCAWEDDFTGYIVDYGTFPDQKRPYFALNEAKSTLAKVVPTAGLEGQIFGGLEALTSALLTREWPRDDGAFLKIERCLIDANWGSSTDTIYQFCRQSAHSGVVMPSHGRYIGAASCPMREYAKKPGDRTGLNWRLPNVQGKRAVRYTLFDTNFWKSFVHARLTTAMGDRGCLSLWGDKPEAHRLIADHLCSEYRVRTEGRGRTVDEYKLRPERPDNHWLDCITGTFVAASIQGVMLAESRPAAVPERRRLTMAEMRKQVGTSPNGRRRLTMAEMQKQGRPAH